MRLALLPLIALFLSVNLLAQDKHFTQFYAAPLTLNPALTGAMEGTYRVSAIYRDQWRSVLENPYTSFAAAADVRFNLELNSRYRDGVAIGLLFFNDQVNTIDFTTNQLALSAAFHKGLDYNKTQFLSAGIQLGLSQRNVNYESLTFDDQFNGIDGYTFGTGENLPPNNFSYGDFSAGLNYSIAPNRKTAIFIGGAIHHFNNPRISFYEVPEEGVEEGDGARLYRKYSAQLSAKLPLSKDGKTSLLPRALYSTQGPHQEINAGTNLRFVINEYSGVAMQLGSWVRPVKTEEESMKLDAVVALLAIELKNLFVGFSYDINLDAINQYGETQGSFEISLTFLGNYEDEEILCPKF